MTMIIFVVSSHKFHLFLCHFYLKGPVQAQPLAIASATSEAGQ